jgi:hypothetical protein
MRVTLFQKTSLPGNSNLSHEFSDVEAPGVIGRALSDSHRDAIIEFLKTSQAKAAF